MTEVLVDTNVILDICTEDPEWFHWSAGMLERFGETGILFINPIIYAEASARFERLEEVEEAIPPTVFRRARLPWEAAFLAGKAYVQYRRRGGAKTSPLPDFYVGAHAVVMGMLLLTRDDRLYRTYFPSLELIAP